MDRDLKQVITVFAVVISFGGGYFLNQWQNSEKIELGEKFAAISVIEDELDGKLSYELPPDEKAVEEAVNAYYKLNDKYFFYTENRDAESDEEPVEEKEDFYEMKGDICYIRYNHFEMMGSAIFSEAYEEFDGKATAYVIDLRGNPGGSTQVVTNILGDFIGNKEICTYHYFNGETKVYKSKKQKIYNKPLVVLADENTASSSEIFIASLMQNYEDFIFVGENTKGKGSFQIGQNYGDGYLKYTAGYYTVGDWECYHNIGIAPDIEIAMDSELIGTDKDIQLQAAIGYLNGEQID